MHIGVGVGHPRTLSQSEETHRRQRLLRLPPLLQVEVYDGAQEVQLRVNRTLWREETLSRPPHPGQPRAVAAIQHGSSPVQVAASCGEPALSMRPIDNPGLHGVLGDPTFGRGRSSLGSSCRVRIKKYKQTETDGAGRGLPLTRSSSSCA